MALYFVTGSLGGGKSLGAVSKIDEYLRRGRKIATNMNLNLEYLCNPDNNYSRVIRVPDGPSLSDLQQIGLGSDKPGNGNHGLLVLDELGTWFNARDFGDKGRKDVIKFCIHLRKLRWDVLFLVPDFSMVDKQMRGNMTQFLVSCQSSQDFWIFKWLPKFHIATIRLRSKLKTGTWWYRSTDLYDAYDTEQLYFTGVNDDDDTFVDEEYQAKINKYKALNGLYCLLPPAYLGDQVRNEIRGRHKALGVRKLQTMALLLLIAGNAFAWNRSVEDLHSVEDLQGEKKVVRDLEQEISSESQPQLEEEVKSPTFEEQYGHLRVRSHARFGMRTRYVFTVPGQNAAITDEQLAELGVTIKPEGPDQARLMLATDHSQSVVISRQ